MKDDNLFPRFPEQSAIIGPDGKEVSMQIVQAVYNEMTGKSEELTKFHSTPFFLCFDDLKQLDLKINQLKEQYNIQSSNCTVTVFFNNDSRESFSSFGRFSAFDNTTSKTVQHVHLKYEFLIILPEAKRPQAYTLSIQMISGIGVTEHAKDSLPPGFPAHAMLSGPTAKISIEYVDYVVARTFLDSTIEWIESLDSREPHLFLAFLVRNSQLVPRFTQYGLAGFVLYLSYNAIPKLLPQDTSSMASLAQVLIVSISAILAGSATGRLLGKIAENSLDMTMSASCVHLTKGDAKLIKKHRKSNRIYYIKATVSVLFTFILGVLASWIANQF